MTKEVEEHLVAQEMAIYSAYKRHEISAIDALLADDFHEIGSSGRFYSKPEVLAAMDDLHLIDYAFETSGVLPMDENNAIVAYIVTINRTANGPASLNRAFRSSAWRKQNGEWRIVFHQATPLPSAT